MSTVVNILTQKEIDQLTAKIPFETTQLSPGMTARAKVQGHSISIYQSKKVMIQGKDAEGLWQELIGGAPAASPPVSYVSYDDFNCIGSDEAGSGDYFGPMTVVASYVSKQNAEVLKVLGVMDSKHLKDDKICELAETIIQMIPHSLLVLDNPKYNERKAMGWSQVKMKAVLHNQAITNVLAKLDGEPLDYIVIDQFAVQPVYERYALTAIPEKNKTRFETKGESKSIAIAASSIIARYAFVKWMDQIEHDTGLAIYKGASAKVDLQAAKIIEKKSLTYLDSITKKDFKNRQKAVQLLERKH